ncbi:MAG: hypothetical protein L6Q92_10305 [Phycisphaerae bacterium]|nr:hypothetical protein [Phycisphaerae bacterium]
MSFEPRGGKRYTLPRKGVVLGCRPEELEFVRYGGRTRLRTGGLQTSVAVFVHRDRDKVVSLVSAIHVADAAYYRALSRVLAAHDRVLYELVTGAKDDEFADSLRTLYGMLAELLQLDSQRRVVEYDDPPANWVHADLSWEQIVKQLKARKLPPPSGPPREVVEEARAFIERYRAAVPASGARAFNARLLKMVFGRVLGAGPEKLERVVLSGRGARRFRDSMTVTQALRNRQAMKVLRRELAGEHRTFVLFFGAAHQPYFARELKRMGFEYVGIDWLTAWNTDEDRPGTESDDPPKREAGEGRSGRAASR